MSKQEELTDYWQLFEESSEDYRKLFKLLLQKGYAFDADLVESLNKYKNSAEQAIIKAYELGKKA